MSHTSTYQPKTAFTRWLDSRLPIIRFAADFMAFGTPRTINYLWTFGAILTFFLAMQIFTGVILAMHYRRTPRLPSTRSKGSCAM
jgi:ubiquinol-cytochrome c reductase cytochrome b subunit